MAGPMNADGHDEVASLLGAYALDAVDADERRQVEEHLRTCATCRAEVADHLEVAAALAGGGEAPAGLWDRIVTSIDGGAPPEVMPLARARVAHDPRLGAEPGVRTSAPPPARGVRRAWLVGVVAAAAVLLVLVVLSGLTIARQHRDLDRLEARLDEPEQRVQVAELVSPDGEVAAGAFVSDGRGYLLAADLEPLEPGWTYQLWGLTDGQARSLGLLGGDPDLETFTVEDGVTTLAITQERLPGAEQPTSDPLVAGDLI